MCCAARNHSVVSRAAYLQLGALRGACMLRRCSTRPLEGLVQEQFVCKRYCFLSQALRQGCTLVCCSRMERSACSIRHFLPAHSQLKHSVKLAQFAMRRQRYLVLLAVIVSTSEYLCAANARGPVRRCSVQSATELSAKASHSAFDRCARHELTLQLTRCVRQRHHLRLSSDKAHSNTREKQNSSVADCQSQQTSAPFVFTMYMIASSVTTAAATTATYLMH
jgi:hypothetical protein